MRRSLALLAVLLLTLPALGCGPEEIPHDDPRRVHIAFDVQPGDGVRLRLQTKATTEMRESDRKPRVRTFESELRLEYWCAERRKDGRLVMRVRPIVDAGPVHEGTVVLGPRGNVEETRFSDRPGDGLRLLFGSPLLMNIIPIPEEGAVLGTSVDVDDVVPRELLEITNKLPGTVELYGRLTLAEVTEVLGEPAARWQLEVDGGATLAEDFAALGHIRGSATQFQSLRSGLPVGTSRGSIRFTSRMKSKSREGRMESRIVFVVESEPLQVEVPAQRPR